MSINLYIDEYKTNTGIWRSAPIAGGFGAKYYYFEPYPVAKAEPQSTDQLVSNKPPVEVLGASQKRASAGDIIPIVFGQRLNNIGGIWVQPTLAKTGSQLFSQVNLFPVSQGELAGYWNTTRMWCGNRNFAYANINPNVYQDYITTTASQVSPNTCPLYLSTHPTLGALYCDNNAYSFAGNTLTTSGGTVRRPDIENNYYQQFQITKGTGIASNSVIRYNNSDIQVFDSKTGNDVTSAYWTYLGINPVGTYSYINAKYSGGTIIGGWDIGLVTVVLGSATSLASPTGTLPYSTGPIVLKYGSGTLIKQINPSLPADTGTLWGVSQCWRISPYVDPTSPPSTKNFTNYSDITWLTVWGNIWDPNRDNVYDPTAPEDIPTDFKQLSVWFDYGVYVDLYSAGLIGGVYLSGSSSFFVDLAMYLFTLMKRANGILTDSLAAPIEVNTLPYYAAFNYNQGMYFNGTVNKSINVIEYISQIAPFFFLSFVSSGGQYAFKEALPTAVISGLVTLDTTSQASTVFLTFTEDTILPGSFQKKYFSSENRRDVSISVLWRDADPAVISKQQTTLVKYPSTSSDAPTVQFDMTDFCCTKDHAIKYAKYELARRKYSTHSISFATQLGNANGHDVTDVIKIVRQRINSRGDNRTETEYYQITKLSHTAEGATLIEAAQFPINASNLYTIINEIVNGTFTIT